MTKEITKAYILQQIQNKFGLREFDLAKFLFSETVHPVYNIEQDVEVPIADYKEISITATAGVIFFTVPQDERWWLQRYVVLFMASGAYTVSGVYLKRKKELTPSSNVYLDLVAGQSVSYINDLPKVCRFDPGDRIGILVDGYTSTADLRLYIDYIREEIR